jgi:xanthine dehydrogenase accessory factor
MDEEPWVLVRGVGDVGSAVAAALFRAGYRVALHDGPTPASPRRGMAFADAMFDGSAILDGLVARRVETTAELRRTLLDRSALPVTVWPLPDVLGIAGWAALVDARMRKHAMPESQRGLAPLTVGLGPNFVAGETVDLAIETGWGEALGTAVEAGPTRALAGEPRVLGGAGRERFVYAPATGHFATAARIGNAVTQGELVARVGTAILVAPLSGVLRGLTRDGVPVELGDKVIEVDPRGDPVLVFGIGERPRRIGEGLLAALAPCRSRAAA